MANWNISVEKSTLWEQFSPQPAAPFYSPRLHNATEHAKFNITILPDLSEKSSVRRIRWNFYYPLWVQTEGDIRKLATFVRNSLGVIQGFASSSSESGLTIDSLSAALGRFPDLIEDFEKIFENDQVGTVPGKISVDDFTVTFAYEGDGQPPDPHYAYKLESRMFWITNDDLPDDQTFGTVRCTAFEYDLGRHADDNELKKSADNLQRGSFKNPLVSVGPTPLTNRLHNVAFYIDAGAQVHELVGTKTFGTLIFGVILYVKVGSKAAATSLLETNTEKEVGLLLEDLKPETRLSALASAIQLRPAEAQLIRSVGLGVANPVSVLAAGLSRDTLGMIATTVGVVDTGIADATQLAEEILENLGAA